MPDVRAWAGRPSAAMERDFAQSFEQESPADFPRGADGVVRYPHLALSGGGANGAFGAGFLNGWIDDRAPPGLQDRHRRVDRRADGAVRVPRADVRRRAARVLHDDDDARHLRDRRASILISLAARRLARRHRAARGADRAARRRRVPPPDRRRARSRPAALHRHRRPRFPAVRRLEHGADRGERPAGGARALPQGHARVGVDTDRLSAGVLRGRGRRAALRRDARRRRGRGDRLPERRRVQTFPHPRARRARPGARGHLRDPQRSAARRRRARRRGRCAASLRGSSRPPAGRGWSGISSASMRSRSASRRAFTGSRSPRASISPAPRCSTR